MKQKQKEKTKYPWDSFSSSLISGRCVYHFESFASIGIFHLASLHWRLQSDVLIRSVCPCGPVNGVRSKRRHRRHRRGNRRRNTREDIREVLMEMKWPEFPERSGSSTRSTRGTRLKVQIWSKTRNANDKIKDNQIDHNLVLILSKKSLSYINSHQSTLIGRRWLSDVHQWLSLTKKSLSIVRHHSLSIALQNLKPRSTVSAAFPVHLSVHLASSSPQSTRTPSNAKFQ